MPEFKTIRVGESAKAVAFDPYEYNYVGRESSGPVEVTTAAMGEEDGTTAAGWYAEEPISDLTPATPPIDQAYTSPSSYPSAGQGSRDLGMGDNFVPPMENPLPPGYTEDPNMQGPPEKRPYVAPIADLTPTIIPPPTVYDPGSGLYIPRIDPVSPFLPSQPSDTLMGPIQPGEQIPTGPNVDYRPGIGLPPTTFATGEEDTGGTTPPMATTFAMGEEDGGAQNPFQRTYGNNPVPPSYAPPGSPRTYQPSNYQGTGTPTTYQAPDMVLPEFVDGSQAMNPLREGIGAIFDRAKQLQGQTNYINPFKRYV